ncbi:hypothetical protein ACLK2E_00275 [Escherichia coli]
MVSRRWEMTASWPIVDRRAVVGAYYYDTNTRKSANQMLGVQYSSCCYAIRVGYERKINGWDNGGSKANTTTPSALTLSCAA